MLGLLKVVAVVLAVAVGAIAVCRLAFPLPDISRREASHALPADPATTLGQRMTEGLAAHPGLSGVVPLREGHDALSSRLALVSQAEKSINAQYYIWHDDVSGVLLLGALQEAARRGVRVRLLLDDNGIPGLDPFLAALDAEDNFEVRLFNPSTVRSPKLAGYAFDFFRMNRRMHNKSLVVDGAAAIVGGRNIGDEYFRVGSDAFYVDMDVLATGVVVSETATVFDAYWNSLSVHGVDAIIGGTGDPAGFAARLAQVRADPDTETLLADLRTSAEAFAAGDAPLEWTDVQLIADDPVKGQGIATRDQLMISRLTEVLGGVEWRLDLVSAYFVPGRRGTDRLSDLSAAGKDVRILTNALDTTDVLMVHAGYTKYRRALLQAGVALYELKLRGEMASKGNLQIKPFGLSGASLHAKTFAVDDARIFIGSFNFDPRSAMLNCEMGYLIDSPALARRVGATFDGPLATVSYRPELTPDGKMVWQEELGDGESVTYQEEPGATWFQQIAIAVIGVLPVEWLL
ncbi:phospholipase D family protein [uncultured Jannaschia sp.]|uniref:phospholipase D family protein n=1 Tax=uncultured Jannaschia sp. TaxID=293347 RepID=UPI00261B6814|nr:phospholipase D family protein [uncultured Jannaschia sp.]